MALETIDQKMLEFLIAEFECYYSDNETPQAIVAKTIIDRFKKEPGSLSKNDVYTLDMIILDLQPIERLVHRAGNIRNKFNELAGAKLASSYQPEPLPPADKYNDSNLKRNLLADLQELLRFIHWGYIFTPIRESIRTKLIKRAILFMVGYTILWIITCGWFFNHWFSDSIHALPPDYFQAVIATVVYFGLIGGYISSQRRMQMIPTDGDPLSSVYALQNGQYFLWFAPMLGAVFAVVLMLLFISGIVQGKIFPAYVELCSQNTLNQQPCLAWTQLLPKTSADYALLFLWSFIAGFAERFVPDTLDRIISRAEDSIKPTLKTDNRIPSSGGDSLSKVKPENGE
ncbi:MAG: hypothetical protein CTY16_00875 [Methylobacter sp.]|nr:MAG: hypothetical protein CTY16_00875 [Methylobacter sp.]